VSRGDGAGDQSPRPGDGPARPAKGKAAAGQTTTRATAMTSETLADPSPAGEPGPVTRERQVSPERQVPRGQLSSQEFSRTPARSGAGRAPMAWRASAVARSTPPSPLPPSPLLGSPVTGFAGQRAP